MKRILTPAALVTLATLAAAQTGKLELASPFSEHMVLQRDAKVPIWGVGKPGGKVVVRIGSQSKTATVTDSGNWTVRLDPLQAGGPHVLEVSSEGAEPIRIGDVMVGEVWLASGQSNMAWTVKASRDFEKERAAAKHPAIRMLTVTRRAAKTPQRTCKGQWKVCSPDTVARFSATAYYFARKLNQELKVPIGIVHASWGGTAIEAWTSSDVQKDDPKLEQTLAPWRRRVANWDPKIAEARFEKQLAGWKKKADQAKQAGKRVPRRPRKQSDPSRNQNHPANLFNGMIAPLIPYGIRGGIWYQGERNARTQKTARVYRHQLPLMIADWRKRWGQGNFPFFWVQLPNFKKRSSDPNAVSHWALMRESMMKSLSVENTGMAVTIDIGEANNIHPKNKQDVGLRLALAALGKTYGRTNAQTGPIYKSFERKGSRFVFSFGHDNGGIWCRDSEVKGFAIAGKDRTWRWAKATVDGYKITVWHPDVAEPVAVRYAWGDNPDCNLCNGDGLPMSPFRTDDW